MLDKKSGVIELKSTRSTVKDKFEDEKSSKAMAYIHEIIEAMDI